MNMLNPNIKSPAEIYVYGVHTVNGSLTKTEAETAEELSKFFKSVYIQEDIVKCLISIRLAY